MVSVVSGQDAWLAVINGEQEGGQAQPLAPQQQPIVPQQPLRPRQQQQGSIIACHQYFFIIQDNQIGFRNDLYIRN